MKVLIADDSPTMRHLLRTTLEDWGYEVVEAQDGEVALDILSGENPPPLAILDWVMPQITGPELCRRVRARKRPTYTYILLLTSKALRQDLIEGMGAGADDYLVKPFDHPEMEVRLRAGRRIVDLQAELMQMQEALREQATLDALTRCWNRSSIFDILTSEINRASRERKALGVIMLDLDHFKEVNDTYGHVCGDEVLKQVVKRISSSMRSYDAIGRYGGEEFICVLSGCGEHCVCGNAERMRVSMESSPVEWQSERIRMTASFGAIAGMPPDGLTADQLIRIADESLYRAKREGRNRVVFTAYGEPA
ncbi:MAG: diguanylate cyclase [Bryobacteraceae bacterium]|jgi:diguanylate cyclase (GGDEF)-like protein